MVLLLENRDYTDLCPVEFGHEDCKPCHSFGPCIRKHYLIHYVVRGNGTFENEKGVYNVGGKQAFLIRPGEKCKYIASSDNPWSYIWIGFTGTLAVKFDECPDVFSPDGTLFNEMKGVKNMNAGSEAFLTGMLFKLYADLFYSDTAPDYVSRVVGYIDTNYMNDIHISDIADNLNLNRKYLARIFKEKMGTTMQDFLIEKRLAEAKKLLLRGYGVKEAAGMTGYADSFAFSKMFKKHFGASPGKVRRNS